MDTLILGAGLAGLALAQALLEAGLPAASLTVCAPAHTPRASDSPGALLHPFPGRSLAPKPGTMAAYLRAIDWVRGLPEGSWRELEMIRPHRGRKLGRRLVRTYEDARADYPPRLTHRHLDASALEALAPGLAPDHQGGLVYGPAFCVDLGEAMAALREELAERGVTFVDGHCRRLETAGAGWRAVLEDGAPLDAERVALCTGPDLPRWFPEAPLAVNGGELILAAPPPASPELRVAISGGGHIAPTPSGRWCYGSTYLRAPEGARDPRALEAFTRPEAEPLAHLTELIGRFWPAVAHATDRRIWRGRRAVFLTDRQPLAGPALGHARLWVLGALGSKGLLWGAHLAERLAHAILAGAPVPAYAHTRRAGASPRWRSPRVG